jgi:NAD(P)-dependent dehydrogenase (short-subunit alcohol dehydrogenase family)
MRVLWVVAERPRFQSRRLLLLDGPREPVSIRPRAVQLDRAGVRNPLPRNPWSGARSEGGYGPAQAAKEALTRDLSAELALQGIRVVSLRPQAMPETRTIKEAFEPRAKASGVTWEKWQQMLASGTHPRRLMTLEEMANMVVFMASDEASGMTGTTVNLTMGSLDD